MWRRRTWCLLTVLALGQGVAWSPGVLAAPAAPAASTAQTSTASQPAPQFARAAGTEKWGPVRSFEYEVSGVLAVDGRGVATVAWRSWKERADTIKAARRAATGGWGRAHTLGRTSNFESPVLAADSRGTVTVAWLRERAGWTRGVWVVRKVGGQPWSKPRRVSLDRASERASAGATALDVAMSPQGAVLLTWAWSSGRKGALHRIQSVYRPAGGRWGPVRAMTPLANVSQPRAAFSPEGQAWIAWLRDPVDGGTTELKARSRSLDGVWSPTRLVFSGEPYGEIGGLGVSQQGDVTIAFRDAEALWAVVGPADGGSWPAAKRLTPAGISIESWSFATNPTGAAVVAYANGRGRTFVVRREVTGTWTSPLLLGKRAYVVTASINEDGDMFLAWASYGIWARYRPASETWHPMTTVQRDAGVDPLEGVRSVVAPNGDAILLYEQEARRLRARVLDVS